MLNEKEIKQYYSKGGWLLCAQELNSTNIVAKELASQGAPEGTLVIAAKQTGGRGRLGRDFESPSGGIYMTLVMRPKGTLEQCTMLTMAAAVGVCRAMEKHLGISPVIKWVNDLYLKGKKVCGILAEGAADANGLRYAVIGIGINYQSPVFTGELADKAGSLFPNEEPPMSLSAFAGAAAAEVFDACRDFAADDVYQEYKAKSVLLGKTVCLPDGTAAEAFDITRDGRLKVRQENGEETPLNCGEVSVTGQLI